MTDPVAVRSLRRRRRTVRALAPVLVLAVGTAGGTAYAYWSAEGAGAAEVKSTTAQPLVVSASATVAANLYPGRTVGLGFTLSNPNIYRVELTTLTGLAITSDDEAACPGGTHLSVPPEVTTGLSAGGYVLPSPIPVAAEASGTAAEIADLVTMSTTSPTGCQGRTFTVELAFSGTQT